LKKPLSLASSLPLLASAALTVAVDSSLCHLSAHVGTPTVALFGPNDPHWRRPLGKMNVYVLHKVECSPCLLAKCPLDHRCQNELDSQEVASVVMQKWQQIQG
jgi:heptosyltransferase-2